MMTMKMKKAGQVSWAVDDVSRRRKASGDDDDDDKDGETGKSAT
jgi:hypothetical protein